MRPTMRVSTYCALFAAALLLALPVATSAQTAVINVTGGSVTEGDAGTTTINFEIVCDPCASVNAIVDWSTSDGSATVADGDYVARSGRVDDLGNGTARETYSVAVTVNGDTMVEGDETFSLEITNASVGCPSLGGPGGCPTSPTAASATGTIINDDQAEAPPEPGNGDEGDGGLPLWLILLIILLLLLLLWKLLKKKLSP